LNIIAARSPPRFAGDSRKNVKGSSAVVGMTKA
jgi:hypothetical protein